MTHRVLNGLGIAVIVGALQSVAMAATGSPIDANAAQSVFDEAKSISDADGGRLWGKPLYGPMLLADRKTRFVVANEPDGDGVLHPDGSVFVGTLPASVNIANMEVAWAGKEWTMIVWPLPDDAFRRRVLIAHELWHRVQHEVGLPPHNPANAHLDAEAGRIWLQLEYRALAKALTATGDDRRDAIAHALLFRAQRRSNFDEAAEQERLLEMNEGLAEYTGYAASGEPRSFLMQKAAERLQRAERVKSFVRSFAYVTGPAYCLLLDDMSPGWRGRLKPSDDLATLLGPALPGAEKGASAQDARAAAALYGGEQLMAAEAKRTAQQEAQLADLRKRFVDGPILRIPFVKMHVQFDPDTLVPLDGVGTVYPTMRITDEWGVLTVERDGVIASDWSFAIVTAPEDSIARPLTGDGWSLDLKPGWHVAPGPRPGDHRVVRD